MPTRRRTRSSWRWPPSMPVRSQLIACTGRDIGVASIGHCKPTLTGTPGKSGAVAAAGNGGRVIVGGRCRFGRGRVGHSRTVCLSAADVGASGPGLMVAYIQGRNVSLTFRPPNRAPVPALGSFDIDVAEGEFVSIVGPSGCGKSTFLNILLGLIKPDSGEVLIHGKKISGPGTDRAMVFQEFGLLPWRTAQNNIELGLELKKVPALKRRAVAGRLI